MRDKKETLDKDNEKLKLKKRAKKEKTQERGITLIALVVTIVILLILAGVTLNIALSDNGLFNKAKKAAEDYKQAQSEEEETIRQISTQMYSEYVGATVTGYDLTEIDNKCQIDNTINNDSGPVVFSRDEQTNWRIWDFDGNILRIITDSTQGTLKLNGELGYNNGVYALDSICNQLYSNGKKEVTARNLKRSDIQKVSTYDYTQYKHEMNNWQEVIGSTNNETIQFGESKNDYDENSIKYPNMWIKNDQYWTYGYNDKEGATGKDKEGTIWENTEGVKKDNEISKELKQSYYAHAYNKNEFINEKYYDLIFKNFNGSDAKYFWLSGRFVRLYDENYGFGLEDVGTLDGKSYVFGFTLYIPGR